MKKSTKILSIKGSELKSALDRIVFDDDVFEFEVDYFWEIDDEEIYDCYEKPKTFTPEPNTPNTCLLYTSPSPRDRTRSRMPSSA